MPNSQHLHPFPNAIDGNIRSIVNDQFAGVPDATNPAYTRIEGQAGNLFHDAADGPLCCGRVVLGDLFANVVEIAEGAPCPDDIIHAGRICEWSFLTPPQSQNSLRPLP